MSKTGNQAPGAYPKATCVIGNRKWQHAQDSGLVFHWEIFSLLINISFFEGESHPEMLMGYS